VVALFAFLHRVSGKMKMKWSLVSGTIQNTGIIPERGLETKWGGGVVITRCGPTRVSGERAKLVFGWPCRNRAPRVGCATTPRSPKSRSQIAGDPAFRGAPSVAVLPRHALRNVAENLVGRAVGQTSMLKGIDAQTITGSEQDHFIPDRNPRNPGHIH